VALVIFSGANAVTNEAFDRVSYALVEAGDQMRVDVTRSRDLIDQLDAEESETEIFGHSLSQLCGTRARQARKRDAAGFLR
jgi:hypothetical protein